MKCSWCMWISLGKIDRSPFDLTPDDVKLATGNASEAVTVFKGDALCQPCLYDRVKGFIGEKPKQVFPQ